MLIRTLSIPSWSPMPGNTSMYSTTVGLLTNSRSRILSLRVGFVTSWSRLKELQMSMSFLHYAEKTASSLTDWSVQFMSLNLKSPPN